MKKSLSLLIFPLISIVYVVCPQNVYARIAVRQGSTGGEFYDTATNKKFTPRGNNFLLLDSNKQIATFNVGIYNSTDAESVLSKMSQYGYNTVRVFVYAPAVGGSVGLNNGYMNNVADFLIRAKAHNIYVMPTLQGIPQVGGYLSPVDDTKFADGYNMTVLTQSGINGKEKFVKDFIQALKTRNAPLDHILGYSLENEFSYQIDLPPFSLTKGTIVTPGGSFDMSNAAVKQRMMDVNLVNYTTQLTNTIHSVDPGSLVAMGWYPLTADRIQHGGSTKWIFVDPENGGSNLDFIDLHFYPLYGSVAQQIQAYQITSHKKPIVMGEFGNKNTGDIKQAATKLRDWQITSCQYNIRGWIFWGWNTAGVNQTGYFSAEESNNAINKLLAPVFRPDPCSANTAPAAKSGDLNNDLKVDNNDYTIFLANFGKTGDAGFSPSDIDKNGVVDIFDYNIFVGNFGK